MCAKLVFEACFYLNWWLEIKMLQGLYEYTNFQPLTVDSHIKFITTDFIQLLGLISLIDP